MAAARNPPRRHKRHDEYELDELIDLTGVEHTFSFLNPKNVVVLDRPDLGLRAPDDGPSVALSTMAASTRAETTMVESLKKEPTMVETTPSHLFDGPRGKRHVREARLAQDGHSLGEQAVYQAMWDAARATGHGDFRTLTIGWIRLGQAARMTDKNAKHNVKSLIRKLAVEQVATAGNGTTYRVFSYGAILRRRREAGLTHIIKHKGVTFVDPDGRLMESTMVETTTGETVGRIESTMVETIESTMVEKAESAMVDSTRAIRHSLDNTFRQEEPSSSELFHFQERAGHMIGLDDDAARTIIRRCRQQDPGATIDEIWHFCEQKILERARLKESIGAGLLIAAIPKYFARPATELNRYRAERGLRSL